MKVAKLIDTIRGVMTELEKSDKDDFGILLSQRETPSSQDICKDLVKHHVLITSIIFSFPLCLSDVFPLF